MKNKLFLVILTALFPMLFAITPVFADPIDNTVDNTIIVNTVDTIGDTTNTTPDNTVTPPANQEPTSTEVTFDNLVDKIIYKLNQILDAMKAIAQPVILILFVSAAATSLFGALSKKGTVWKGVWAMVVAGIVFSVITYADVIVTLFTSWLVS